jgi:[ribosomal protein S18]-alanine N-acetyltransferase
VSSMILQPLTHDRVDAALDLDRRCLGGIWNAEGYRREITSECSDLLTFSYASTLLALGCSWAIADEGHITLLAVDPNYQHQGLGQAMLFVLLRAAHQRGLERATLEVRASNQAALSLYAKFGFREAGRRKRYYQDNQEDALVLWRSALQYPQFKDELAAWETAVHERLQRFNWQLTQESEYGIEQS